MASRDALASLSCGQTNMASSGARPRTTLGLGSPRDCFRFHGRNVAVPGVELIITDFHSRLRYLIFF